MQWLYCALQLACKEAIALDKFSNETIPRIFSPSLSISTFNWVADCQGPRASTSASMGKLSKLPGGMTVVSKRTFICPVLIETCGCARGGNGRMTTSAICKADFSRHL